MLNFFSGPALIFINPIDKAVLDSYVKYYRPVAVECDSPDCLVFPNRKSLEKGMCCTKIAFTNLSKLIHKTAILCTAEKKITSRILRRSQITALWTKNDDPAWRNKVAAQCGHSLETARRYYEFSEKVTPGLQIVGELHQMREEAAQEEPSET